MATIIIGDLSANADLDRKAMQAIAGGSRGSTQPGATGTAASRQPRIVDFRTGAITGGAAAQQTPPGKPVKT